MTDFTVTNHGSVWTIEAVSDAAKAFANENLPVEGWMGSPTNFTTDWRPGKDLAERLESEGWNVDYS